MKSILGQITLLFFVFNSAGYARGWRERKNPRLTVVIVLDQCAHYQLEKLKPFLKYGFKDFFDRAIVYDNALHPHGLPGTAAGHHGISTGTLPKDHGVVANRWFDKHGNEVQYGEDGAEHSRLLIEGSDKGFSNHHTKVEGLSDQFSMTPRGRGKNHVFSISIKPRAAIATANKTGKAIWFDSESGQFTSSKSYFEHLPSWLVNFNYRRKIPAQKHVIWKHAYPDDSPAYQFDYIDDYEFAGYDFKLAHMDHIDIGKDSKYGYALYVRTPLISEELFELARQCVDETLADNQRDRMLLWVCVSNLDILGHIYGPDSFEAIDMFYHVDRQLQKFMRYVMDSIGFDDVLFVLTADHGVQPLPEIARKRGIATAHRLVSKPLMKEMNRIIYERYGIEGIVANFTMTYFRFNHDIFDALDQEKQGKIIADLKNYLEEQHGIKKVWTPQVLADSSFEPHSIEQFYKNHLYAGRQGDLICQPHPYALLSKHETGTSHNTPYNYNTHVPLMLYQRGKLKPQVITDKVWIPQLPVTLARMLGVPKPSSSTYTLLPGDF